MVEAAPSPKVPKRNSVSTTRRNLMSLKIVGNCRIRRRENKSDAKASVASAADNSESDCLVVFAGCIADHDEWILDSACSFHMCTNRDWFSSYEPLQNGGFVHMGDDNPCEIVGIGSVQIKTHDGMIRTLKNVRHISGMKRNLISLSTLDKEGLKYTGSSRVVKV